MTFQEIYFQSAKDFSVQLITISSAIIGLSVTFLDKMKIQPNNWLKISWLLFIISILFGIIAIAALVGHAADLAVNNLSFTRYTVLTTISAGGQEIAFFLAIICLVRFGWLHSRGEKNASMETAILNADDGETG